MKKLYFSCPRETAEKLNNPERGFYSICKYTAGDDEKSDGLYYSDPNDVLLLLEINLCKFTGCDITDDALDKIRDVFNLLMLSGLQLIVRFLYDWEGKNLANEPRKIEIIQSHMKQLCPIVKEYSDRIFVFQGLFIGDWGEMHGTRYSRGDYLKKLYATLSAQLENCIYLAVRTPAQWRCVTGFLNSTKSDTKFTKELHLPGLFNDGIMGSISDLGTYGETMDERKAELDFQDRLCAVVPNGGEAVGNDDLSNAEFVVTTLSKMHISYLNRNHDEATLGKWKAAVLPYGGIWEDMSVFDYVGLHLGYRFVIDEVKMALRSKKMKVRIGVKNTGFAPIYHETTASLVFEKDGEKVGFELKGDLRDLCGITRDEHMLFVETVPTDSLSSGEYNIYFRIFSKKYGCTILTANENSDESGCLIGRYIR